jgi:hypothetical protein
MKAWLITWEWTGNKEIDEPQGIAAILNSRLSRDTVLEFAKLILVKKLYSLREQMEIAQKTAFWKEHFEKIYLQGSQDGLPLGDKFTLGNNPSLQARKVDKFRVEDGVAKWEEIRITPERVKALKEIIG